MLTRVRPATDESIEPKNDNNDPNDTDLSKFDFEWKKNDALIDIVKRARERGVTNYFLSPIEIEDWMNEANPEEYVEWAMAIIRRWRDQGVELPFYSIMNEPGYVRGGIWSGGYLRDVIKLLGPKLEAEGFVTKIIAPDDIGAIQALERLEIIMNDPGASQYIGAFGYHLYGGTPEARQRIKEMSLENNIPVWMTEWSANNPEQWVDALHDQISEYNVSAVDHMWGFFGEWEPVGTHFVSLLYSGAQYTGYRLNKNYYLTGQYSRYVRPGFRRIDVESSSSAIRCTAYTQASDFVQVCANRGGSSQTIQVNLSGVSGFTELQAVRTSYVGGDNWAELSPVAVSGSSFTVTLPATSVTTYIYKGASTPPPEITLGLSLDQPSIDENNGTNMLTVSRAGSSTENALLVNLSSSDISEATVPATVLISVGSESSAVSISAVDDAEIDGDQSVTFMATADNAVSASVELTVLDDDVGNPPVVVLGLQLDKQSMSENGGTSILTVSRNGSTESALLVNLSSNDISEATVLATVLIPVGNNSSTVSISAVDDAEVDGDQLVTFAAIAENANQSSIFLTVRDDEVNVSLPTFSLSLTIEQSSISEDGGTSRLTVSRTGSMADDLEVELSSSDTGEATLPASVVIPAGSRTSNAVLISAVNDVLVDGNQSVTFTATADNATEASNSIVVRDVGSDNTDTSAPELSNRTWTIHGTAGEDTTKIRIDKQETTPDLNGIWSLTLPLLDGENTYRVVTTKSIDGQISTTMRNIVIVGPVEQIAN